MTSYVTASSEVTGTGEQQGTGLLKYVHAIILTPGSVAATLTLRNGKLVTDTIKFVAKCGSDHSFFAWFPKDLPLMFDSGLYAQLAGAAAVATIVWRP